MVRRGRKKLTEEGIFLAGIVIKPEDYKYSSARNYAFDDYTIIEVDTDYAGVSRLSGS